MSEVRERLSRLVELASENAPEKRRMLALELCDLLLDWPASYPMAMREPFEALLEKTVRLIDRDARNALIARVAAAPSARRSFRNAFFFDAPADVRPLLLQRNAQSGTANERIGVDEGFLVKAARRRDGRFAEILAEAIGIDLDIARRVVQDNSAQSLAIAVKGAGLSRAAFSALVLLVCPGKPSEIEKRLAAFDEVEDQAATAMLCWWREQSSPQAEAA